MAIKLTKAPKNLNKKVKKHKGICRNCEAEYEALASDLDWEPFYKNVKKPTFLFGVFETESEQMQLTMLPLNVNCRQCGELSGISFNIEPIEQE